MYQVSYISRPNTPVIVSWSWITVFQSIANGLVGQTEQRDLPAVTHVRDHLVERVGVAAHLEPDVEALPHVELALDLVDPRSSGRRPRRVAPSASASSSRYGVHVGHDDVARAGVLRDRAGHEPDRPGPGDQHVLPEHGERAAPSARRCRTGRRSPPRPDRSPGRGARRWSSAARCSSANAPGRLTPTLEVFAQRWRRPARQLRHRPQTTCPSPLTSSPGWKSLTLEPTSTTSPTNSWPTTSGGVTALLRPLVPIGDVDVGAADPRPIHTDQHVVDPDLRARAPA